ncbi:MAG TPA: hypothetical protein VHT91_18130 [Kofleriaceae bacterium]|jgi:hypothetical protein|nr:hypothetical protein [Kofleriaceae bacterium]
MIGRLAVVGGLAVAGIAHAEPKPLAPPSAPPPSAAPGAAHAAPTPAPAPAAEAPDPAVEYAADANLESTANRRGFVLAGSLGGGLLVGLGIEGSTGRGGSFDLRLGHVATPRTVITFEFGGTVVLHGTAKLNTTDSATYTNTNLNLLAGAQYYATDSLWLRFAGGLGRYQASHVKSSDMNVLIDVQQTGPAVLGGIGLDLARFKWAVFGLEIGTSAMIRGGVVLASDLRLGVAFD